jgi:ADP-ribose pyrophosphatase
VVTADATRELAEETGYSSTTTVLLGEYVTDTALLPTRVSVVECVIAPDAIPAQTDAETSERRWVPLRRVRGMIAQGLLHDAHSLSALSFIADRWT